MAERPADDVLDVLACDFGARPAEAPGLPDVLGSVRAVHREGETLVVAFDPADGERVHQVVEAERVCCAEISWDLTPGRAGEPLVLRIGATADQLDLFENFLTPAHAE